MKKIVDYLIEGGFCPDHRLSIDEDREELITNVEMLLKQGYQPMGAPFLDKEGCMCQAMVMYKEF